MKSFLKLNFNDEINNLRRPFGAIECSGSGHTAVLQLILLFQTFREKENSPGQIYILILNYTVINMTE